MTIASRTLRCTVWPAAVLLVWIGAGSACLADGGGKIGGAVESAYSACLSSQSSCKSVARTQLRVQYKRLITRTFSVRVRVSRIYQLTLDDDLDDGSSEEQQASKFNPPLDTIDVKLRFSDLDGRDHFEGRIGYAYQYPNPNAANGYHTTYISGDYFFGPPIPLGWGSLSRRWDVLVRFAQDEFAAANLPPEELGQVVPTYTIPINSDGSTRTYVSYAREQRFLGSNNLRTPSNRFEFGATRDPTRWLEFYGKILLFATRSVPGTAKAIVGVEVTFLDDSFRSRGVEAAMCAPSLRRLKSSRLGCSGGTEYGPAETNPRPVTLMVRGAH